MALDDKIDVSHYLQHFVVFMYVVYDMMVKRLCSIYIFTKCSAIWTVFSQGLMISRNFLHEWPALGCTEHGRRSRY